MLGGGRTGTGDASDGHVVDEAGAGVEHPRQAGVVGGRGGQANEVDAGGLGRQRQLGVVFGWQVDHDQAIHPRFGGFRQEALHAIAMDGVVVAHQHQRRLAFAAPEVAHHLQGLGQILTRLQGAQGSGLDGRAIGHGIGEGHAQLDDVGTGRRQALEDGQGGVIVRIAGGGVGDQGRAALGLQRGEAGFQAAHSLSPR